MNMNKEIESLLFFFLIMRLKELLQKENYVNTNSVIG